MANTALPHYLLRYGGRVLESPLSTRQSDKREPDGIYEKMWPAATIAEPNVLLAFAFRIRIDGVVIAVWDWLREKRNGGWNLCPRSPIRLPRAGAWAAPHRAEF